MHYQEGFRKTVKPLITIAIPTYQRLTYLQSAVESALGQTYPHLDILISQDPTPTGLDPDIQAWSQALANQHPQVRYQANPRNLGLAGNWNAAATAALGDYTVTMGDDDILLPRFVETLVKAAHPDTEVIFSNHFIINSEGVRLVEDSYQWTQRYQRDRMPPGQLACPEAWVWQNAIPIVSALVKTASVQRLRFREDLNTPEIELFLRLTQAGTEFIFVPDYLVEYRVHGNSATTTGRGLRNHRLMSYLLPLAVQPEIEPYKRDCLAKLMVNAVNQSLLDGEKEQAKAWLSSSYYPPRQKLRPSGLAQRLCAALPGRIGLDLYRKLHATKQALPS
jgi:GT2 family glycosyltransferase